MTFIFDLIKYHGQIPFPTTMSAIIYWFSQIIGILFFLLYFHQIIYLIVGTFHKAKIQNKVFKLHTVGVVISARNESKVIANLIKSVRENDYPQAMVKIFVIADNCSDNTAQICRDLGCVVFERHNLKEVGKGYALNFLFNKLHTEEQYRDIVPEFYLIMDADNVMSKNYITEMNKAYDNGYNVCTSYRKASNFGKNWITSGYGYWFLHESKHLNNSRMVFNMSATILGTGILISSKTVYKFNNFDFHFLTEDVQFNAEYILNNKKIGYQETAEFTDEQVETLSQSIKQRERWAKGFYQVCGKYGGKLLKSSFKNFSCWDFLTSMFPALLLSTVFVIGCPLLSIVALILRDFAGALTGLIFFGLTALSAYMLMFVLALLTCITEWKKIDCPNPKKILYLFTFPIFMLTYIPIAIVALFKKVEWKPIEHKGKIDIENKNNDLSK